MITLSSKECPQGSPQWWKVRCGIPTSSEIDRVISPKKGEYSVTASKKYAAELVAASLGWESRFKGSPDTERGNIQEAEARKWIRLQTGMAVHEVGFCLSDCKRYGTSPDGLLDDGTPVEIKNPDLHTFIAWVDEGGLPVDHKAQCHMHMHVTGKDRCLFLAYQTSPYVENIMVWVERDEFTAQLAKHLETFCDKLDVLRRKVTGDEYEVIFGNPNPPEK